MNEIYCSTRLIRTNTTTSKKSAIFQEQYVAPKDGCSACSTVARGD
ncbi:hypothetical protein HanXRQr2_Chr06g0250521 [Helianthus annuus]|uniref:Uncharacterized protein n=2 Tax=Helianthus annuus TaxID=4232 RepID=A0A9K3IRH2_HELAN|nr:hypothetical protein HanXRQr2_Chr06g0250521 [Helianthus annuus]